MISRTGMMWFLLSCFANSNRRLRISIIICMIVQIVVNSITIVQIVVQCGPNPYYAVSLDDISSMAVQYWLLNRPIEQNTFITCGILSQLMDRSSASRPMFRRLSDLSKEVCAIAPCMPAFVSLTRTTGFNTIIDMYLAGISAFELWQFFIQTLQRNPGVSVWAQFRKINPNVRSRRIWQTLTLSGYVDHRNPYKHLTDYFTDRLFFLEPLQSSRLMYVYWSAKWETCWQWYSFLNHWVIDSISLVRSSIP